MALASVERPDRATAIRETRTFRFLAIILVVLAGVCSKPHLSLAQGGDACPPPAGFPPLADPPVTAQQVEDGTGSLRDFALAARERSREHAERATTVEQGVYIACVVRQEGGALARRFHLHREPDARRQGVHTREGHGAVGPAARPVDLPGDPLLPWASRRPSSPTWRRPIPRPASALSAAVFATLLQEPDAPFDATVPVPGLRPGIPGASGYASVYVSPEFRSPIVLLAGFDIDASHLSRRSARLRRSEHHCEGRRRPRDPEGLRHAGGELLPGDPAERRSGRCLEGQDGAAGSERALAARLRVSLRPGYGQQHHHVSRRVPGRLGVPAAGADRP